MPNPNEDNPIQKLWEYIPPYTAPNYPPHVEVITTTNTGDTTMTDTTNNFDPAPRLQQIAATIRERGAYTFDAPATAAYYIECAIKEIERLHRDYSCICNEMRRMMNERDEARRQLCIEWMEHGPVRLTKEQIAMRYGWDCFKENNND